MRSLIILLLLPLIYPSAINAKTKIIFEVEGKYASYSYDHNQILCEKAKFQFNSYDVECLWLKIDVTSRSFIAQGKVILKYEKEILEYDELLFNPQDNSGVAVKYGQKIIRHPIGIEENTIPSQFMIDLDDISLDSMLQSFLYFTCSKIRINDDFEVFGNDVILYIEGLRSLSFRDFKLSEGFKPRTQGFALDKIWFTKSQGIIGQASYLYEKENVANSLSQIHFEERSILKNNIGPARQLDLTTSTSFNLNQNLRIGLNGNYNSSSLWNANIYFNQRWSEYIDSNFDITYNKPVHDRGETWIGFRSNIHSKKLGGLSFSGKYELKNQVIGNLNYTRNFFKYFDLNMATSYTKVKVGRHSDFSKLVNGNFSLAFNAKLFSFTTNYYLNYDLISSQILSQPNIQINLNSFQFYGGLLTAKLSNILYYNNLIKSDIRSTSYSNNTIFNLSTAPLYLHAKHRFNFNLSVEQFLEKEGRNFTSSGLTINTAREFSYGISVEGYYSIRSRRKTKGWLIEGTTSQDLSLLLRMDPSKKINGWTSFSYDPKHKQWRQSFTDLSLQVLKNWTIHSLINYDFLRDRINNIDLYLIRDAGRIQLRFIWRSLSKQFLIELIPK